MANPWFRLWTDMVNDPKWRTISRVSKQRIGDVVSVYLHMLTCAANATERGRTQGWSDEDVATALDIETEQVAAIREAMQGRVLEGDYLTGWERRQPKREDEGASERAKAWREAQKAAKQSQEEQCRTQANASERKETLDTDKDKEERESKQHRATRLPADWMPGEEEVAFCQSERPDLDPTAVANRFRDYWHGIGGQKGAKLDWTATWRNWVRSEKAMPASAAKKTRGLVL